MKTRTLLALVLAGAALFGAAVTLPVQAQTFCVPPSVPPDPPPPDEPPTPCEPAECDQCPAPPGCGNTCYFSPCHISQGTYVEEFFDYAVVTASFPLEVSRRYVSSRMVDGPLGIGWTSSLTTRLYYAAYLASAPSTYTYEVRLMLPNGIVYRFTQGSGNTFNPPPGRLDKLIRNADSSWDLTLHKSDVVMHFDAAGALQTITDEFGTSLGYVYDVSGRLQRIEDRSGSNRYLDIVWGSDGRIASVTARATGSPLVKTVQYAYNTDGTLFTVTNPVGHVETYAYTAGRFAPLLQTIHDHWNRQITRLVFDSAERLTSYTDGDPAWGGETFTYSYSPQFSTTSKSSSTGVKSYSYTTNGFATNVGVQRDAGTGRVYSINNNGYPITYTYDTQGRVTVEYVNAGAYSVWFKYSYDTNFPSKVTALEPYKDWALTQRYTEWQAKYYTYYGPTETGKGRLKQIESLRKDGVTRDVVVRYSYDDKGRATSTEEVGFAIPTTYAYNAAGDLISQTDLGSMTYGYDALGRRTSLTDKMGATTTYEYDALDRLTAVTYPAPYAGAPLFRATISYDHFDAGKNLLFTHEADLNGHVTKTGEDVLGNVIEHIDALNNVTKYTHANNLLTKITDANGNETSYTYNTDRRLQKTTFPDATFETYNYNTEGQLFSRVDRAGVTFAYLYDAHGRLLRTSWNNLSKMIEYEYLGGEMPTAVKYYNGTSWETTTYTYDSQYRPLTEVQGNRGKLTYTYFAGNPSTRLSRVAVESATGVPGQITTTDYTYDSLGRILNMWWSAAPGWSTIAYNANGQYTTITDPYGHSREYQYDGQGRLTLVANKRNSLTLASFAYGYDDNWTTGTKTMLGQRTSVDVAATTALYQNAGLTKYYYDAKYQLVRAQYTGAPPHSYDFTYDAIGNRLTENTNTYSYFTNSVSKNTQRLNTVNNSWATYDYDTRGNVKRHGNVEFIWDDLGQLLKRRDIGSPNALGYWYEYDGLGRRVVREHVQEKVGVLFQGIHAVSERPLSSTYGRTYTNEYLFLPGVDEALMMKGEGLAAFFVVDGLGSVVGKDNSSQETLEGTSYTPFGRPTQQWPQHIGFTGREAVDQKYWYYRARYYEPETGRFLSEDPLGFYASNNHYTYVDNDPILYVDPSGLARARDPNGAECRELARKISNIQRDITEALDAIRNNPRRLPFCRPGGQPRDSVVGHLLLLGGYQANLIRRLAEYNDKCGGGGTGGPPPIPVRAPRVIGAPAPRGTGGIRAPIPIPIPRPVMPMFLPILNPCMMNPRLCDECATCPPGGA